MLDTITYPRAATLLCEIILGSLLSGRQERSNKETVRGRGKAFPSSVRTTFPQNPGLNLLPDPFWLDWKRSIRAAKWENNCSTQHRLWSMYLDTTWLAGTDESGLGQEKTMQWRMKVTSVRSNYGNTGVWLFEWQVTLRYWNTFFSSLQTKNKRCVMILTTLWVCTSQQWILKLQNLIMRTGNDCCCLFPTQRKADHTSDGFK